MLTSQAVAGALALCLVPHSEAFTSIPASTGSVVHGGSPHNGLRSVAAATREDMTPPPSSPATVGVNLAPPRTDPGTWFTQLQKSCLPKPSELQDLATAGVNQLGEVELPHRKQEPFRYTNLESLFRVNWQAPKVVLTEETATLCRSYLEPDTSGQQLVFVNGVFSQELSDVSELEGGSKGLFAGSILSAPSPELAQDYLSWLPEVGADHRTNQGSLPFACLNAACMADAAVITVDEGVKLEKPIQVLFFSEGEETVSHPRLIVASGKGSDVTIMQGYAGVGKSLTNAASRFLVGEGAKINHIYSQEQSLESQHIDTVTANVGASGLFKQCLLQSGAYFGRVNLQVELTGEEAHTDLAGLVLASGNQQLDNHTELGHSVPGATSEQDQRQILADSSDVVFKGRIRVDGIAQQTDSNQICRTLMLSDKARVTAMPSLEITADDVKCAHGATVADLDEESLFYLASRGINKVLARALVIKGFAADLLDQLPGQAVQARLTEKLQALTPTTDRAVQSKGAYQSI
ncbi:unnamed protein product [Chrysoparadoxa australica]